MAKKLKTTNVKYEKTAKLSLATGGQGASIFHFEYVDKEGKFAFNPGRAAFKHKEVLQKIIDFYRLTYSLGVSSGLKQNMCNQS